jgi:hypothetical protein
MVKMIGVSQSVLIGASEYYMQIRTSTSPTSSGAPPRPLWRADDELGNLGLQQRFAEKRASGERGVEGEQRQGGDRGERNPCGVRVPRRERRRHRSREKVSYADGRRGG